MGLDIALMNDPSRTFSPENGDRYLGISFTETEWGNFFFTELGASEPAPYIEGEDIQVFDTRRKRAFHDSLTKYPMLSRIDDYYQDAFYRRDEIRHLLAECIALEGTISDRAAMSFLIGMIYAAKQARLNNMGLLLAAD